MDVLNFPQLTSKFLSGFIKFWAISPLEKSCSTAKVCAVSILMLILGTFCFEIYGRWNTNFSPVSSKSKRSMVVVTLNTCIIALCNVVIVWQVLLFKEESKQEFIKEINKINSTLKKYIKVNQKRRHFSFHLVILNIFYAGIFCNDVILWFFAVKRGSTFFYYWFDQCYRYRISILVLYIYHVMCRLLEMITAINLILTNTFKKVHTISENVDFSQTLVHLEDVTKDVSELYVAFIQVVTCFNRAFGWQILFILLNYIFLFVLTYEDGLRNFTNHEDVPIGQYVWCVLTMAYSTVGVVMVTSICNKTSSEARRTADLSFYYYYNLNMSKYHPQQACLMENLSLLVRQTRGTLTTFSAAGFFPVNYSTLFLLMNLVTSYLIVLIKFE